MVFFLLFIIFTVETPECWPRTKPLGTNKYLNTQTHNIS